MKFSVSVEYIRVFMYYAPKLGLNSDEIYRRVGLDPLVLDKPGAKISVYEFNKLMAVLEEVSPDDNIGLHIGEIVCSYPVNIWIALLLNGPTVGIALNKLCQDYSLLVGFASPYISIDNELVSMALRYYTTEFNPTRHTNEALLAAFASALRFISNHQIQLEGVYFAHPTPKDISEHQRIFNAPLFFNQTERKLVFKEKHLQLPVHSYDANLLEAMVHIGQKFQEMGYTSQPWSVKVGQIIMNMLKNDKAGIDSIAQKLGISPRNLQHRLSEEGITYKKLLDDIRKERALYLLEKEKIPISEIAFMLGYSDQSVFARAFKRWVGSTPLKYRSQFK